MKNQNLKLRIINAMEKVLPQEEPITIASAGSMLANERHNIQIAVFNAQKYSLRKVSIRVTGRLAPYATIRQVGYNTAYYLPESDDYILSDKSGIFADVLTEEEGLNGFCLRSRIWTSFYITINGELPIGDNELIIKVSHEEEEEQEAVYSLEVLAGEMPQDTITYASWLHYDCIADAHGCEVFGTRYYNVLERYITNAYEHGVNMIYTPLFTPPLDTYIGGERRTVQLIDVEVIGKNLYKFGFGELERFVTLARRCGMKYVEFSHLFTQWGAKACPKVMARNNGKIVKLFGWETDSLSIEYRTFLTQFLTALKDCIKRLNIEDICFFHISDEPMDEHYDTYSKIHEFLAPLLEGYKVMEALSNYMYYKQGAVDIPVVVSHNTKEFQEAGAKHWVYYCAGQCVDYLSNRFLNMPLQRTRIIGLQLYLNKAEGFLHWGYNFYNNSDSSDRIDPYAVSDAGGYFPSGDGFVVYPGVDKPRDSLRNEMMAEAMQDYAALVLLEKLTSRKEVEALLEAEGIEGYRVYPRSMEWHTDFRIRLNQLIKQNLS